MEKESVPMQQARKLANSPAGQQLLELLQASDPKAMEQARNGDYGQALQALKQILSSPKGQQLFKDLGR